MEKVAEPGRMRPFSFACLRASRPGFTCEFADRAISRHQHRISWGQKRGVEVDATATTAQVW